MMIMDYIFVWSVLFLVLEKSVSKKEDADLLLESLLYS